MAQEAKSFPSYQAAATALVDAMKTNDTAALKEILGSKAQDLLSSGDSTEDSNARQKFVERYEQKHGFAPASGEAMTLTVGTSWYTGGSAAMNWMPSRYARRWRQRRRSMRPEGMTAKRRGAMHRSS
jgi:hypothetical protein